MSAAEQLKEVPASAQDLGEHKFTYEITEIAPQVKDKLERELTFRVQGTNSEGKALDGTFTCIRRNLGSFGRYKVIEAQLNGGVFPGPEAAIFHDRAAYLTAHLTNKPDWFNPLAAYEEDYALIEDVNEYVTRWERRFRRPSMVK